MCDLQDSIRSNGSSLRSSASHLQKKVEELCLLKQPDEWQKEQEYNYRRNRRKMLEKQIEQETSQFRLKLVRFLFIPAGLGVLIGIIMLFGATIRSLGDGSVFWMHRQYFAIIGPVLLVFGLVLFFVAEGVQHYFTEKLRNSGAFELKQEIHPDFHITNNGRRINDPSKDQNLKNSPLFTSGDSFLCSSISSTSTAPDFTSRWVRAMNLNVSHNTTKTTERSQSFESDDSYDSTVMRALVNAPEIEITDTEPENSSSETTINNNAFIHVNKGDLLLPNGRSGYVFRKENTEMHISDDKTKKSIRTEKVDAHILNGKSGSLLRNGSAKSFQGFHLEGISEESLVEIHVECS